MWKDDASSSATLRMVRGSSPRSRRHQTAAASHILSSRSQSYLRDWVHTASHIHTNWSQSYLQWRRQLYASGKRVIYPCWVHVFHNRANFKQKTRVHWVHSRQTKIIIDWHYRQSENSFYRHDKLSFLYTTISSSCQIGRYEKAHNKTVQFIFGSNNCRAPLSY